MAAAVYGSSMRRYAEMKWLESGPVGGGSVLAGTGRAIRDERSPS
ncbi:hypothetical protein P3T39_004284 [Kitasatospora sp. GP82]|nr:hypothetical protein [Kitasatospora sp. GP82]